MVFIWIGNFATKIAWVINCTCYFSPKTMYIIICRSSKVITISKVSNCHFSPTKTNLTIGNKYPWKNNSHSVLLTINPMLVIEYSLNIRNLLCNRIIQYPIYFTRITNMSEMEHIFKVKKKKSYIFISLFVFEFVVLKTIIHNMTKFHDDRFFFQGIFFLVRFLFFRPGIFYQTKKNVREIVCLFWQRKKN